MSNVSTAPGRPAVEPHIAAEADRILQDAADRQRRQERKTAAPDSVFDRAVAVAMGDVTVISDEEDARRRAIETSLANAERIKSLHETCHVPARYALADLDDVSRLPDDSKFHWQDAGRKLLRILQGDSVYIMCGRRGPGKTHLACALINRAIRDFKSARYAKLTDYVNDIKSCFGTGRSVAAVEREWTAPFLLVLDEEQERFGTSVEHVYVTRLIDLRYDAMRPTLLISNQEAAALEASLGSSIVSRAMDGGGVIPCDWPSVRGRLQQ